jgi:serine/threonine protein phosphatase PrpC
MPARVVAMDIASRSGSRSDSQDRVFTTGSAIVVLDGASSSKPQHRDGGWYAEALGTALVRSLTAASEGSLQDALASAIVEVASAEDRHDDAPSSTVAIARWRIDRLDVLVLGDSTVAVFTRDDGVTVLCDDRLEEVAAEERSEYQAQLRAGGGFGELHRENLKNLQSAQRTWRNRRGGYWIAEMDPAAAAQAITRSWPLADVSTVMLATDGMTDGITRYGSGTGHRQGRSSSVMGLSSSSTWYTARKLKTPTDADGRAASATMTRRWHS